MVPPISSPTQMSSWTAQITPALLVWPPLRAYTKPPSSTHPSKLLVTQFFISLGLRPYTQCSIHLVRYVSFHIIVLRLSPTVHSLFLHPLYRSSYRLTPRLRRLARRTLVAAAVALVTSAVNMVVLTIMHGQQLGWVCLGSCGTDVTINALALYFVTNSLDEAASADHAASPLDKRRSGTPTTRKPQTGHPPENGLVRSKGMLNNDDPSAVTSQRTILFPGAARTNMSDVSEYEMTDKLDVMNPAQTTASILMSNPGSGTNRSVDRIRDTYLGRTDTLGTLTIPIFHGYEANQLFRCKNATTIFGKTLSRYCRRCS